MSSDSLEPYCDCGHTKKAHWDTNCDQCNCAYYELSGVELNPKDQFDSVLIKLKEIHDKKKADYASKSDRFSNFVYAGSSAGVSPGQAIEVLIGTKQARLIELSTPGREIKNEPLEDTLLDRAVYCILALAYYLENKK